MRFTRFVNVCKLDQGIQLYRGCVSQDTRQSFVNLIKFTEGDFPEKNIIEMCGLLPNKKLN